MKKTLSVLCFLVLLAGLFIPVLTAMHRIPLNLTCRRWIRSFKNRSKPIEFGCCCSHSEGRKNRFSKGYGDAAPANGKPANPVLYRLGQQGVHGLAVMKLVDQGKLELDAPVQTYLPWFKVADAQVSKQITIRNLLNHTSGLTEKGDPNSSAYTAVWMNRPPAAIRQANLPAGDTLRVLQPELSAAWTGYRTGQRQTLWRIS